MLKIKMCTGAVRTAVVAAVAVAGLALGVSPAGAATVSSSATMTYAYDDDGNQTSSTPASFDELSEELDVCSTEALEALEGQHVRQGYTSSPYSVGAARHRIRVSSYEVDACAVVLTVDVKRVDSAAGTQWQRLNLTVTVTGTVDAPVEIAQRQSDPDQSSQQQTTTTHSYSSQQQTTTTHSYSSQQGATLTPFPNQDTPWDLYNLTEQQWNNPNTVMDTIGCTGTWCPCEDH